MSSEFGFWKNIFLVAVFLAVTPITLGITLFSLLTFKPDQTVQHVAAYTSSGARVYASLPDDFPSVSGAVAFEDARPEIVRQYLKRYNSVLVDYSDLIVELADKYGIDYRLIPAIAQQESNLCKFIPPGGHNCWGWGIHSRGTLGFNSFPEAIETVTSGLKREYIDKGYTTPDEIMKKYTPSSPGTWAAGVNQFMAEMQ